MRPVHVWLVFALCVAALVGAMVWSSATVLRLEKAERGARARAALEENTRLALWRLDSAVMPLLAQEAARPSAHYDPPPGELSPLVRATPSEVLLHFDIDAAGALRSPQVPEGYARAIALGQVSPAVFDQRTRRLETLRRAMAGGALLARLPREPGPLKVDVASVDPRDLQKTKNVQEYVARQQTSQKSNVLVPPAGPALRPESPREGALAAVWIGDALVLARRVGVGQSVFVRGCWLDWDRVKRDLLASIQDLLPGAELEPASPTARPDEERRLATLPVRLVPGPAPAAAPIGPSPARLSLTAAWIAAALAALAGAALLRGVMDLSERRRVFVSAVTHELRTPLTTFRLYTDMLADGMVPDEARRGEYLARLRTEAQRLDHLVENVLYYARVESGRAGAARETLDLQAVLDQVRPRLVEVAARARLDIVWERRTEDALPVRVDRSAVEQVLLNLVDNACKYAAHATPPRVHVVLDKSEGRALLRVSDHGPGIARSDRRRLFQPFSKSDHDAANSAPGIGLGLALSRRLARAQDGELGLDASAAGGATFVLSLPLLPTAADRPCRSPRAGC